MIFCGTLSSQRFCIDFQNNLWCTQVLKLKLLSSIDSKINYQYYFWQLSRLAEFNIILIRCQSNLQSFEQARHSKPRLTRLWTLACPKLIGLAERERSTLNGD